MNGMSKTTLAAETNPLGAMAFIQKYFGSTPDHDSCDANICLCEAGDSNSSTPWDAVLGRSDLVKKGYPAGKCILRTASAKKLIAATGWTAVLPTGIPGRDCNYVQDKNVEAGAGDEGYMVYAHDADTCCKSCAAVKACTGATWMPLPGDDSNRTLPSSGGPPDYEGFGLHLPAITGHTTLPGLTVREVESIVAKKMGQMDRWDAWMDYNVALYTLNLDKYLQRFKADGVPFLGAKWPTSRDGNEMMYSAFIHVPDSQMIIELMAESSQILDDLPKLQMLEQRLSSSRLEAIENSPPESHLLLPVRVSRAASDLTSLDAFYGDAMRISTTLVIDSETSSVRCYLWPGAHVDLCFVQRPQNMTSSDLTVKAFEDMLKHVSESVNSGPMCNMNRWADNHYALDIFHSDFDYIVDYLDATPTALYTCATFGVTGLHYIYDPTGWAVQLNMRFKKEPKGCNTIDKGLQHNSKKGLLGFGSNNPPRAKLDLPVIMCGAGVC